MTNAELLAKIKAEVERLQDIYADAAQMYTTDEERFSYAACAVEFGDAVYSFLSTLESEKQIIHTTITVLDNDLNPVEITADEKPMNQEELEKEIRRFLIEEHDRDTTVGDVARHFAQWGAEHLKK